MFPCLRREGRLLGAGRPRGQPPALPGEARPDQLQATTEYKITIKYHI